MKRTGSRWARRYAVLLCAAAAGAVPVPPARGQLTAVESTKLLEPADGFEATLWAAEPLVQNPTNLDIDSRGRIWITEGRNYRLHREANKQFERVDRADQVKILEDVDGDGRADRVTIFAEDIYPVPMGIAIEERWSDGRYTGCRVFVGNSPNLLVLEDADGDDRADRRYNLLTGFGGVNSDHGIHGMSLALDGKLYFTHGDGCCSVQPEGGEKRVNFDVTDRSGRRVRTEDLGSVLRVNRDGTQLEVMATRLRNDYEACVSSYGDVFVSDNDDDGNRGSRMIWVMDGGNYGYRTPGSHRHWGEEFPGIVPKLVGTGNGSPVGILVYEGALFGKEYEGAVLQVDAGTHQVNFHPLKRVGGGFRTDYKILLGSTDSWYRPIDAAVAPDGSLYVVDWYDSGVGGHRFVDQTTGRIHRVAPKGAKPVGEKPDFGSIRGLVRALQSPVVATRFAAAQLLVDQKEKSVEALRGLLREGKPIMRARALQVLYRIEGPASKTARAALQDDDPRIRETALRLLARDVGRLKVIEPEQAKSTTPRAVAVLDEILPLMDDPDAGVRRELAIGLRDVPTDRVGSALVHLADLWDGADRYYLEALVLACRDREPEFYETLFETITSSALAKGDLLYHDLALPPYFPTATNDAFLRDDDHLPGGNPASKVIGLAWALKWDGAIAYLERLVSVEGSPRIMPAVELAVAHLDPLAAGGFFARRVLKTTDPATQRSLIGSMGRKLRGKGDAALEIDAVGEVIETALASPALQEAGIQAIGTIGTKKFTVQLMGIVEADDNPAALRAAGIEALGKLRHKPLLPEAKALLEATKESNDVNRLARAALSAYAELSGKKAKDVLADVLTDEAYPLALRRQAMQILGGRTGGGLRLLDLAKQKKIPDALGNQLIAVTHNHPERRVRRRAQSEIALPASAQGKALPPVRELLSRAGDAKRGENVFFRAGESTAACGSCHRVQGRGKWIGPDLSTIGTKYGKDGLLDSILNPSGAIGYNYQTAIVQLTDGRLLDGLIASESADRLVLKTAQGDRLTIATADIAARRTGTTSLMPEGLAQAMSEQDLVDLLAFLASLRSPTATVAEYRLLGPITPKEADRALDPTATVDTNGTVTVGRRVLTWRPVQTGQDGWLDLAPLFGGQPDPVTFGYLPVDSTIAQSGRVVFDTPVDVRVWVNGKPVELTRADASNSTAAGLIRLEKGSNQILFRIQADGDDPGLSATIVTEAIIRFAAR